MILEVGVTSQVKRKYPPSLFGGKLGQSCRSDSCQMYAKSLDSEARARYKFKLNLVGIEHCPYKVPADKWIDNLKKWPSIQYLDVFHYLVKSPRLYSMEAMENYRSLEAHTFFTSGWVQTVSFVLTDSGNFVFKADVKPSWRVTDEPHHPWVAIKKTGPVITAHCDCMAGLGETCSHVGALLFKMEAAVRLGHTRSACTDEPCVWNACFVKNVKAVPVSEIRFYKESSKKRLRKTNKVSTPQEDATEEEQQRFLDSLASLGENIIALSSYSQYSDRFSNFGPTPDIKKVPTSLRSMFSENNCNLSDLDLKTLCEDTFMNLSIKAEEAKYLEEVSRQQASTSVWHEQRLGRITSSVAHETLHTNPVNPAVSLIKKICQPQSGQLKVPAVVWGVEHEEDAFNLYHNIYCENSDKIASVLPSGEVFATHPGPHEHCSVEKSGFVICLDKPYLGASPDGIVNCECCGKGVIEIKCSYKYKNVKIQDAFQDSNFCVDSNFQIKKQNKYYSQVQHQMYVCEAAYADLIVWTPIDCIITRVPKDADFIEQMLVSHENIWKNAVLPELLCRKLESLPAKQKPQKSSAQEYCYCRTSSNLDNMVGCDRCDNWFHPKCVNLKRLPKTKTWYCPECRKAMKKSK